MPTTESHQRTKVEERFDEVLWGATLDSLEATHLDFLVFFNGGGKSGEVAIDKLEEIGEFGKQAADWLRKGERHQNTVYGDRILIEVYEEPFFPQSERKIVVNTKYKLFVAIKMGKEDDGTSSSECIGSSLVADDRNVCMFDRSYLESECGNYRAIMQWDGNFVLYNKGTVVWTTGTDGVGDPRYYLKLQWEGNLAIHDANGDTTWCTNTNGKGEGPYRLVMQMDRNLVLFDGGGEPLWATNTALTPPLPDPSVFTSMGSTLTANGSFTCMVEGCYLQSECEKYRAVMQRDGNFVLYDKEAVVWESAIKDAGQRSFQLRLQLDGNLVIYDSREKASWASGTHGKGKAPYRLVMQSDRNLVLYDGSDEATWATNTMRPEPQESAQGRHTPLKECVGSSVTDDKETACHDDSNHQSTSVGSPVADDKETACHDDSHHQSGSVGSSVADDKETACHDDSHHQSGSVGSSVADDKETACHDDSHHQSGSVGSSVADDKETACHDDSHHQSGSVGSSVANDKENGFLMDGSYLQSACGKYRAILQCDGNFVVYDNDHSVWASGTDGVGNPRFHLKVQRDGNVVIYDSTGKATWTSGTDGKGKAPYRLVMQNDRNLVLYDDCGNATWATNTVQSEYPPPAKGPHTPHKECVGASVTTDNDSVCLMDGSFLQSSSGQYRAIVQRDGNFVVYDGGHPVWASGTDGVGSPRFHLKVQRDGNVVIYDSNGMATWVSGTNGQGTAPHRLVMQDDRNLVLYDGSGNATWATNTCV